MQNIIEIKHLYREDKIKIMEVIWGDLSREPEEVESSDSHQKALYETEKRLDSGQEKIIDWKAAQKELREQFE